jgi:hypothetical protein
MDLLEIIRIAWAGWDSDKVYTHHPDCRNPALPK